jgi:VWFA-related protein
VKAFTILLGIACITAKAQAPVFQSESKVVLVDAVVTGKKGEYIRDLTAKDFRVWEDGKEQTIKSFSVEAGSAAGPSSDASLRLVLFFDNTGMNVTDQASVRQAAAGFIDASFADPKAGANRLMAVVNFDDGLRVAQSFTDNAARLKEAVRGVRFTGSTSPVGPGYMPGATAASMAMAGSNARGLIRSVEGVAQNLNALPGRKIIVLFTGNTSAAAAQQADVANLVQISNRSNVAIYPVTQGSVGLASGTSSACGDLPPGFSSARRPADDPGPGLPDGR